MRCTHINTLLRIYAIRNWLREFENVSKVILHTFICIVSHIYPALVTLRTHIHGPFARHLSAKNHPNNKTIMLCESEKVRVKKEKRSRKYERTKSNNNKSVAKVVFTVYSSWKYDYRKHKLFFFSLSLSTLHRPAFFPFQSTTHHFVIGIAFSLALYQSL